MVTKRWDLGGAWLRAFTSWQSISRTPAHPVPAGPTSSQDQMPAVCMTGEHRGQGVRQTQRRWRSIRRIIGPVLKVNQCSEAEPGATTKRRERE
jgi:hypothetical protein